jgi:hypothetical protein
MDLSRTHHHSDRTRECLRGRLKSIPFRGVSARLALAGHRRVRFDGWDRGSIHAAEVAALDLDDAGGAGTRGDQLSRHAARGDQASCLAAELGLKAKK